MPRQRSAEATRETPRPVTSGAPDRFLSMVAHEMRNSLTVLHCELELLATDPDGAHTLDADTSERLRSYVERLTRLTQDIAEVGRNGSGFALERTRFDLGRAVATDAAAHEQAARLAGITLHTDVEEDVMVDADAHRLGQVVSNLLGNALRFTPPRGTISVQVQQASHEARVTVRNTGSSLSRNQRDRLFQAFSQVHDDAALRKGGLGLGLYISRGIVAAHGGRIWCESEPGLVTFSFAVPTASRGPGEAAEAA